MQLPKLIGEFRNWVSYNVLSFCIRKNWYWSLETLAKFGLDPNATNHDGMETLLRKVAEVGDDNAVCSLLRAGADPNKLGGDVCKISPLQYAIMGGCNEGTIFFMLHKKASVEYNGGRSQFNALDYAVYVQKRAEQAELQGKTFQENGKPINKNVIYTIINVLKDLGAVNNVTNLIQTMKFNYGITVDPATLTTENENKPLTPLRDARAERDNNDPAALSSGSQIQETQAPGRRLSFNA